MYFDDSTSGSQRGSVKGAGLRFTHPLVTARLAELGATDGEPPAGAAWRHFVEWVSVLYGEVEELRALHRDATLDRSSFEHLFRHSPVPIMQQDYSRLKRWMKERRREGARDLVEALGGEDLECIRSVVPMIEMTAANPAAERAVGLSIDEMLGPIDPRIVNPGSEGGWLAQLKAVWEGEPVAHAAFTAQTADGIPYDAESVLATPLIDGKPDFSRAVFTIIDVTPHRQEERRMQELIEAKDRFLASVSHEVRTPLTAILGFARLLEQDPHLPEDDQRMMIASIAEHAQEMSDLVEDLLVAARVELGQIQVVNAPHDVVAQIGQLLTSGASFTRGVKFEPLVAKAVAMCDPARLRQVLRNLLTNAERYGGPNVAVVVDTEGDDSVVVDVVDDGPGIPPHDWDRIFEPYQRAHDAPGQPDSVGVGLAISRQLATLMGGTLDYRYDGRSVFRLRLPPPDITER